MRIIFDLDGTLIDSSDRMYILFCELIPQCSMSKNEYWDYKRDKVNHKQLISMLYPETDFDDFNKRWMDLIEEDRFLNMDLAFDDTEAVLDILYRSNELYLLTARQLRQSLLNELERLNIRRFFKAVLTTEGLATKEEVLLNASGNIPGLLDTDNLFVSDMGKDIQLGNKMGFSTAAITHGFMNENRLREYSPDFVIRDLNEIVGIVSSKGK